MYVCYGNPILLNYLPWQNIFEIERKHHHIEVLKLFMQRHTAKNSRVFTQVYLSELKCV